MTPQQCRNGRGRLVSCAQPYYFRGRTQQGRHFGEINVLRHNREPLRLGVVPYVAIVGFRQATKANVIRFREKVSDSLAQPEAEVLVEQQLHVEAVTSRLS